MNAQTVKAHLAERGKLVEEHLRGCVADPGTPERLREAMLDSLLAGGKRLRPVLCLTTASLFGADMARGGHCCNTMRTMRKNSGAGIRLRRRSSRA